MQNGFIMSVDVLFLVGHAAVADLMQHMLLGEFFVKDLEKGSSYVGGYIFAVWVLYQIISLFRFFLPEHAGWDGVWGEKVRCCVYPLLLRAFW